MSIQVYKEFQFRFCWDVEEIDKIRVYVEQRPDRFKQSSPTDLGLHPTELGAPEYILFPEGKPVVFLDAVQKAKAWADRVLTTGAASTNVIQTPNSAMEHTPEKKHAS